VTVGTLALIVGIAVALKQSAIRLLLDGAHYVLTPNRTAGPSPVPGKGRLSQLEHLREQDGLYRLKVPTKSTRLNSRLTELWVVDHAAGTAWRRCAGKLHTWRRRRANYLRGMLPDMICFSGSVPRTV